MQTWEEFLYWEHKSRQTIDFKMIYVDISGDLIAGLMLSQIVYWHLPDRDGRSKLKVNHDNKTWLARSDSEWMNEVRITKAQARRARQILSDKNIIEEHVYKFNGIPTTHIRLNQDVLMRLIHEFHSIETQSPFVTQDKSICVPAQVHLCSSTSPFVLQDKSITESTTENTSEITNKEKEPANAGSALDGEEKKIKTKKNKSALTEEIDIWTEELRAIYPKDRLPNSKQMIKAKLRSLKDEDEKPVKLTQEVIDKIKASIILYNQNYWQFIPEEDRKYIPLLNNFIGKGYWLPDIEIIERRTKQLGKRSPRARENFNSVMNDFMKELEETQDQVRFEIEQERKQLGASNDQ